MAKTSKKTAAAKKINTGTLKSEKGAYATYKLRLNAGHYKSLTGARRGAGRMDLSDAERKAANALAKKKFGS